ncbi:hypothetical protein ACWXVP_01470 [Mycoplasma sp. 1781]
MELKKEEQNNSFDIDNLIKTFEEYKKQIDKRIALFKDLSLANSVIMNIDDQLEQIMTKNSQNSEDMELSLELNNRKTKLTTLREQIKDLLANIFQQEEQLSLIQ